VHLQCFLAFPRFDLELCQLSLSPSSLTVTYRRPPLIVPFFFWIASEVFIFASNPASPPYIFSLQETMATLQPSHSPANRALRIPELLINIFDLLDKPSNANNARVCKQWSDIAFGCLWSEVDNICHLFNKLAPLPLWYDGQRYVSDSANLEDPAKLFKTDYPDFSVLRCRSKHPPMEGVRDVHPTCPTTFLFPIRFGARLGASSIRCNCADPDDSQHPP
jgi:hypothetical protein